jgi:glutathione synthase/RimK-type ligase-like ATP-grasp enzyme
MNMDQPHTILIIEAFKDSLLADIERLAREHPELGELKPVLITSNPHKYKNLAFKIIETDYSKQSLEKVFDDLGGGIRTVICRGDAYIQYLRKIIPYLAEDAYVSSEQSLQLATHKQLMREAFTKVAPEISPKFVKATKIADAKDTELTFPVIVKPASLASSILVQKCDTPKELQKVLKNTLAVIKEVYEKEGRTEDPEVIIEEFLVGEFYSIDSYVLSKGEYFHCPPVSYVPAESMGVNDFSLYKRQTPVSLTKPQIQQLEKAAEKALDALGLQYTSAHIELVKTEAGWKIIEVGPRIGRFRNTMYTASFGIPHGYNDLLIHCGLPPLLKRSQKVVHTVAHSIYPREEGILREVTSLNKIQQKVQGILYFNSSHTKGEHVKYAKNGGHALVEVVFGNSDIKQFREDCSWFEAEVGAKVVPITKPKDVIGRVEFIGFPDAGISQLHAKVDTGAYRSAIWATDIYEKNGKLFFTLLGPSSKYYTGIEQSTEQYKLVEVENSFGHKEQRYSVFLKVTIAGRTIRSNFSLANRGVKTYPALIGRKMLKNRFVVDVSIGDTIEDEEIAGDKSLE